MTSNSSVQKLAKDEWVWPIDLTKYDRNPRLSPLERKTLGEWKTWADEYLQGRKWPGQFRRELNRLLLPIFDSMKVTKADRKYATPVLYPIFQEMVARKTAYWSWSEDDWLEIWHHYFKRTKCTKGGWRQHFIGVMYFVGGVTQVYKLGGFNQCRLSIKIFGLDVVKTAIEPISQVLSEWGYGEYRLGDGVKRAVCEILLVNRSPFLAEITPDLLKRLRDSNTSIPAHDYVVISRALVSLGIHKNTIMPTRSYAPNEYSSEGVPEEWVKWCNRWLNTTTMETASSHFGILIRVGRWLAKNHPGITSPEQWTKELATDCVAAINNLKVGEWTHEKNKWIGGLPIGKDCCPSTKNSMLSMIRAFFRDCQDWGWIPFRFDPKRYLSTPSQITRKLEFNPRIISDDIWAKLLWAGLNLRTEDLPVACLRVNDPKSGYLYYPAEAAQALTLVWLFAGLRLDEIMRLRVGCIRWRPENVSSDLDSQQNKTICLLEVPVNKTSTSFTKPVDGIVGEAISNWEKVRPRQPQIVDSKTGELVDFLFTFRGKRVGKSYLNQKLIPVLCKKAGVPEQDAKGPITTHRARSTIASQLYNAKDPMTLFELKDWLGHRSLSSTQHYAKISATKTYQSFQKAGYFERNRHMIEVLLDQDAIRTGAAASGAAWKYYDLGHGYCTYDFFDQCPHRMACAKCSFYLPKGSTQAQILEAKSNLNRMLESIPLTDEERSAVEDGIVAMNELCDRLADVVTPDGSTPRQMVQIQRRPQK